MLVTHLGWFHAGYLNKKRKENRKLSGALRWSLRVSPILGTQWSPGENYCRSPLQVCLHTGVVCTLSVTATPSEE